MRFELTRVPSDRSTISGTDSRELEALLDGLNPTEHFQLWLFKENGDSACVLANSKYAYLSILPEEGDYLVSSNGEAPDSSALTRIYLENGQLDELEIGQCILREAGIDAGLQYFRTGIPSPSVNWLVE